MRGGRKVIIEAHRHEGINYFRGLAAVQSWWCHKPVKIIRIHLYGENDFLWSDSQNKEKSNPYIFVIVYFKFLKFPQRVELLMVELVKVIS